MLSASQALGCGQVTVFVVVVAQAAAIFVWVAASLMFLLPFMRLFGHGHFLLDVQHAVFVLAHGMLWWGESVNLLCRGFWQAMPSSVS